MKVCFETFGCRLNKAEALQLEADYLARGWEVTQRHSDANLFIVRGCSVTARAQSDCENTISHLKRHYPNVPIRVCGCLTAPGMQRELPFARDKGEEPAPPVRTARAYLKVQDGCSGTCTFCIVPKFRGTARSEDFTDVLDRAKRFIETGYHEIVVTGCNLALYASQGRRLPELVCALADLDEGCRIRIGSLEPWAGARETVQAMAERKNVCRFLHLPIQSGSTRILKSMRRPYASKDVDALVAEAVKLMPGLGLGCDLMSGFPDESDLDHLATAGLLKRHPFTNAHVFPYSERPGTQAAGYPNVVPRAIRSARAHELSDIAAGLRTKFARSFIGKTVEIVVERHSKTKGWTGEYLPCEADELKPRKSLVRIRVTRAKGETLFGSVIT